MTPRGLVLGVTVWLAASLAAGCGQRGTAPSDYIQRLQQLRNAKDRFMLSSEGPLTPEQRRRFRPLRYFAPDTSFVFVARLERSTGSDTVGFVTSKHSIEPYLRRGRFAFERNGRPGAVTAFESVDHRMLFVPFVDETSGSESYGGGRYVELDTLEGGRYRLDFNRAYNPYCAYNDDWVCPLPPPENRLRMRIEAGEKAFPHTP